MTKLLDILHRLGVTAFLPCTIPSGPPDCTALTENPHRPVVFTKVGSGYVPPRRMGASPTGLTALPPSPTP